MSHHLGASTAAVEPRPVEAVASVVVPAHDEARVLPACLAKLAADEVGRRCQVVVVANGCTDDTAAVAREFQTRFTDLVVLEIEEAGKIGALNAGDAAAQVFPRIYLDADILLEEGALSSLVGALTTDAEVVASPSVRFDTAGSSFAVREFYRAYEALPYVRDGLVGLGVYGMSYGGRSRFERFPDLVADDLFVQRCFTSAERLRTAGSFTVRVPRGVRDLVSVRRRSTGGALELADKLDDDPTVDAATTTGATLRALAGTVVRHPRLLVAAMVYVVIAALGRVRPVRSSQGWTRDESSRLTVPGPTIVDLDGLPIWSVTQQETVEHVLRCLEAGQGGVIATPNVDIMRRDARSDQKVLDKMDVLVPDGMPLMWASRLQGEPLRDRVPGSDLVWALSTAAAEHGRSVYLLGGAPGVAERAADAFRLLRPDLRVAGTAAPRRGFESSETEMAALRADLVGARPDLVFVALGHPRQEELAVRLREVLPHAWFLGCGGSFDMAAGDQVRAPQLVQRLGLEWLHRLRLEPGRLWRRYLVDDIPFAVGMLLRASRKRIRRVLPPRR